MKTKSLLLALVCAILCTFTSVAAEPYAVFTSSDHTLTFYYGTKPSGAYSLNMGDNYPEWYENGNFAVATRVVFDASFAQVRPTTTAYWFYKMNNLTTITGLNYLNTSQVTNMGNMFCNCSKLSTLDLSNFNTSKVTDMNRMFYGCSNLPNINLSSFTTSNVTNMAGMFYGCENLTTLDVSKFNTSKVTNMSWMFDGCNNLLNIDVSHFNTSNVVAMNEMFCNCSKLTTLDVSNFNTQNVKNMECMFTNVKVPTLDLSNFNTSNVTAMNSMFAGCSNLTTLDLSSFNTSKVTTMSFMFEKCGSLQTIIVSDSWSTTAVTSSLQMFQYCIKLVGGAGTTYDSSHTNVAYAHIDGGPSNPGYFTAKTADESYACYTPSNKTLTFYYDNQRSSHTGTTYDLNTDYNRPGWRSDGMYDYVHKVVFAPSFVNARPTSTYYWFGGMTHLESITGINYLNTSEVTEMRYMFDDCSQLSSLDVSGFNTAKVTKMGYMFRNCTALTSLDVSNFNTAQATDLRGMFSGNSALTNIDLSNFNTANVTNMNYMFYGCSNLKTIYAGNAWSTAAVTNSDNMFSNCTKLVGGKGTTYDANHIDAAYAHIDGGTSNPGYFTAKAEGILGDLDGSGIVDVEDVNAAINIILKLNTMSDYPGNGDMDNSGMIDVEDVNAMINIILKL